MDRYGHPKLERPSSAAEFANTERRLREADGSDERQEVMRQAFNTIVEALEIAAAH